MTTRWISVAESLPEKSGWYHIWGTWPHNPLTRQGTHTAYFYTAGEPGWRWHGDGEITHWMPLPEAPK